MNLRFKIGTFSALVAIIAVWSALDDRSGDLPLGNLSHGETQLKFESDSIDSDEDRDESDGPEVPSYMRPDRRGYAVSVFSKDAKFPDGESLTLRFYPRPSDAQLSRELDNRQDPGFVERLLPEIEKGNGYAAYRLYKSLVQCQGAPQDEAELAGYLDQLDQTFTHPDRSSETGTKHLDVDRNTALEKTNIRSKYRRCLNVPSEMTNDATRYLRVAADANVIDAALEYAGSIKSTEPETAAEYYEKVWNLGEVSGAYELGRMYLDGEIGTAPDPVTGYAYLFVGHLVSSTLFDGLEGDVYDQLRANQQERFDQEVKLIRPNEMESALPIAKDLLLENSKCCMH